MKKIIILCAVALFASAAVFTAVKVSRSSEDLFIIENVEALADADGGVFSPLLQVPCVPEIDLKCFVGVFDGNGNPIVIVIDGMRNILKL